MENIDNVQVDNSFINNKEINDYLLEASKWGKFLGIVGYIGMGLLVIVALLVMAGASYLGNIKGTGIPTALISVIYLILAVIYYFPVTYLFRFSVKIRQGLNSNDEVSITSGFQNLKSLLKFMGIFTIVILSIYVLALLIAMLIAIFSVASY
jgi:hypothetical protein